MKPLSENEYREIIKNTFKNGYDCGVKAAQERAQVETDKLNKQIKIMRDALERIHGMSEAILENATYITQETYASKIARQGLKEIGEVCK